MEFLTLQVPKIAFCYLPRQLYLRWIYSACDGLNSMLQLSTNSDNDGTLKRGELKISARGHTMLVGHSSIFVSTFWSRRFDDTFRRNRSRKTDRRGPILWRTWQATFIFTTGEHNQYSGWNTKEFSYSEIYRRFSCNSSYWSIWKGETTGISHRITPHVNQSKKYCFDDVRIRRGLSK